MKKRTTREKKGVIIRPRTPAAMIAPRTCCMPSSTVADTASIVDTAANDALHEGQLGAKEGDAERLEQGS